MSDRLIDDLADSIAGRVKATHPAVYEQNEQDAYQKYARTAGAAGLKPVPYSAIKKVNEAVNNLKKKAGAK